MHSCCVRAHTPLLVSAAGQTPLCEAPTAEGSEGVGPKGHRSGGQRRGCGCSVGGSGVCFGDTLVGKWVCINERQGAGQGRSSRAGQGRNGPEAALLGAGEASEEVMIAVVLSHCQRTCSG